MAKSSSLRSLSQEDLDFFEESLLPEADSLYQLCLMIHLNRHEAFQTFYRCIDQISQNVGEIRNKPIETTRREVMRRAVQVLNLLKPEQQRETEADLKQFETLNVELRKLLCLHDHLGLDLKHCEELLQIENGRKRLVEIRLWYTDIIAARDELNSEISEG